MASTKRGSNASRRRVRSRCSLTDRHASDHLEHLPDSIAPQLALARAVIERHLGPRLLAIHLYGSALQGGLRPHSDIDLLVTVDARLDDSTRRALVLDLLDISAPPGGEGAYRALETTVLVRDDVQPWRHPARRELQFGEWQRQDILADRIEPATSDIDLAILLTQARQHGIALHGPPAREFFAPIPAADLLAALAGTLDLWHVPRDWAGDERNVVLTLARIWYTAATGSIVPKDVAADWAASRLPEPHRAVAVAARLAYLGLAPDALASRGDDVAAFVAAVRERVRACLR